MKASESSLEREQKYSHLKLLVDTMITESDGKVLNAVEIGTSYLKGGDDVDLYLITEADLQAAELDELRSLLVVGGLETHVFTCTREQFAKGDIVHNKNGRPISGYLGEKQVGFDPHLEEIAFEHPGMVNLFLFGTMRQFSTVDKSGNLTIDSALAEVRVDYEDVREWVQLYTAAYLGQYLSASDAKGKSQFEHAERISKFLLRIMHGDFMEHLNHPALNEYVDSLKVKMRTATDSGKSPDDLFAFEVLESSRSLSGEDKRLITLAYMVRDGNFVLDPGDLELMEGLLMYEATHFRIDSRTAAEGGFNTLSLLALYHLCNKYAHKGAEEITFEAHSQLIAAGASEDWLFLIPPFRKEGDETYVQNGNIVVKLSGKDAIRKPGRTVGELGVMFDRKRSNDVFAGDDPVFALRITKDTFLNEILNPYIINELKSGDIGSTDARIAHSLLLFTMFDISAKLRDSTIKEQLRADVVETDAWLKENNPLDDYLLGQKFLQSMVLLSETKFMIGDQRLVEKRPVGDGTTVLFRRGATVNGKFYVLGEGCTATIKPDGEAGHKITMQAGAVFGEASLLGESTRSAQVEVSGGDLYEVNANAFLRLTSTNRTFADSQLTSNQFMYHIAAVETKRILSRLTI